MFTPDQYELIDFGVRRAIGYKLERFGNYVISRPSPAADSISIKFPELWGNCDAEFSVGKSKSTANSSSQRGRWNYRNALPEPWNLDHRSFTFQLKPTPFGHIGVFVEQQENWDWIARKIQATARPIKVLNLFSYTGGSTLAAAAAGAEVVHVDSAKNVVNWARGNASLSDLESRPIRWIVEDCNLFVKRERKRGNQYDAIILDPPSFGHGPSGEVWKIDRDLIQLLRNCRQLLTPKPAFFLMTCHSPGFGPAELQATVCDAIFGTCSTQVDSRPLAIPTADGRRLNAGNLVRWPR